MAKMFEWLKPTGSPATNGYDVGRRDIFTTSSGILNVARPRTVGPKSKFTISVVDSLVNTLPMINQPFNRGQFVLDFYQVPMKQVMSKFDEFYTQLTEDFESVSPDYIESSPLIPHVDLYTLNLFIAYDVAAYLYSIESFEALSSSKIGFKWFDGLDPFSEDFTLGNVPNGLASRLIFGCDVHGYPVALGLFRLLDLLGYGNFYLMFKECILSNDIDELPEDFTYKHVALRTVGVYGRHLALEIFDGDDAVEVSDLKSYFEDINLETATVDDVIGTFCSNNFSSTYGKRLLYANALKFFAYQKVFNDIYRNSFYDKLEPLSFNSDWFVNRASTESLDVNEIIYQLLDYNAFQVDGMWNSYPGFVGIFTLRYRQFKKDLYTSLLPNSQFGDVSMVNVGDSLFNLKVTNGDDDNSWIGVASSGDMIRPFGDGSVVANFKSSNLTFSVLMQRRAEALQKYKERFLRAGNRLKDQYISEFGKVPYYLEDRYVRYLGSIDTRLNVQGVPATADSGAYDVGERGAYGYAGISGKIEFAVDDWSIIVPIFYYLPELDYESFGLEADNKFSEFSDYYVPEFENLGLEPQYRTSLSLLATSLANYNVPLGGERVIGYGPSYMYFKTDIDKVHGEFGSTNRLKGIFHTWVTTRGNVSMAELSDYYVRPDFADSIMKQKFTGPQSSDNFLVVLDLDWKAIQPLSVVGLPIWN